MVIFHSYVKLPEGKSILTMVYKQTSNWGGHNFAALSTKSYPKIDKCGNIHVQSNLHIHGMFYPFGFAFWNPKNHTAHEDDGYVKQIEQF